VTARRMLLHASCTDAHLVLGLDQSSRADFDVFVGLPERGLDGVAGVDLPDRPVLQLHHLAIILDRIDRMALTVPGLGWIRSRWRDLCGSAPRILLRLILLFGLFHPSGVSGTELRVIAKLRGAALEADLQVVACLGFASGLKLFGRQPRV